MMLGFFLLAPLFVWVVRAASLGPVVASVLGLQFAMLCGNNSAAGIWRAAGTCAALMVGLAILVVMQMQGQHDAQRLESCPTSSPTSSSSVAAALD